jgi:hypothetical protein
MIGELDYNQPFDFKNILELSKHDGSQLGQLAKAADLLKEIIEIRKNDP